MYRDHPFNGVGVRAYGVAYPGYAEADDPHMLMYSGATVGLHAHNIVLEFMSDTGTIGLLGLVAAFFLAIRFWRGLDECRRAQAFPFAASLMVIAFPLNSYFSLFGVYTSSVTWVLIGLMCAAGMADAGESWAAGASGNAHEGTQVGDGDNGHRDDEENADDGLGHGA
jgi:O-antigen ligase